ncbi:hypothetical protein HYS42_00535, partial [Candidatus Saccharibacteria bacterium]|nr:hypothetical protein [Candidatus Saccharibacteria bacterium]
IGNGNVATGNTNTINIGATATSTGKNVVTIGSTIAASSLTLQGGTGHINLLSTGNIIIGTSDTTGTLLVLDTKTGAGDPTGVNGGLYYNSNSTQLRGYINGAWNTIGGTNTGTTIPTTNLYDGRTFRLRVGSSPYEFIDLVYDATYAKWVSENSLLFGTIGTSGGGGDYDTLSVGNSDYTVRGTPVAYKNLYNAGLRLQIRQYGMFQSSVAATYTTTYNVDLQDAPNFNSSGTRAVLSSGFVSASIGGLSNNTWYGRDSTWSQVAVDGTSRDQLTVTWRWSSAGTQTMYANARVETRWVSQ